MLRPLSDDETASIERTRRALNVDIDVCAKLVKLKENHKEPIPDAIRHRILQSNAYKKHNYKWFTLTSHSVPPLDLGWDGNVWINTTAGSESIYFRRQGVWVVWKHLDLSSHMLNPFLRNQFLVLGNSGVGWTTPEAMSGRRRRWIQSQKGGQPAYDALNVEIIVKQICAITNCPDTVTIKFGSRATKRTSVSSKRAAAQNAANKITAIVSATINLNNDLDNRIYMESNATTSADLFPPIPTSNIRATSLAANKMIPVKDAKAAASGHLTSSESIYRATKRKLSSMATPSPSSHSSSPATRLSPTGPTSQTGSSKLLALPSFEGNSQGSPASGWRSRYDVRYRARPALPPSTKHAPQPQCTTTSPSRGQFQLMPSPTTILRTPAQFPRGPSQTSRIPTPSQVLGQLDKPAKRVRVKEPTAVTTSSSNTELTFATRSRHTTFWHPDGSVVVQVGDTLSRLHRSRLCNTRRFLRLSSPNAITGIVRRSLTAVLYSKLIRFQRGILRCC
ncbi:hypothetical protein AcW1_005118 [Taiwanofungus camphoratus]|nr:hypothetical protein AcV7_002716 [Antrodia cinnamomea]KAI0960654.1 hypothetical protein AcW1_005118 [Antrodia cinnamomea]